MLIPILLTSVKPRDDEWTARIQSIFINFVHIDFIQIGMKSIMDCDDHFAIAATSTVTYDQYVFTFVKFKDE